MEKLRLTRELANLALILLGIASGGMGLAGFLLRSNFIDGGVTGVSMLLARATGLPLALLLPAVNLPFIALLGVEAALYSILTYVAAARTLDFIIHGIDQFTAITIVSERSAEIRERITVDLGRGVTVYSGEGGLSGRQQQILFCVVTRL